MISIAVIGGGVVGSAVAEGFGRKGFGVKVYDPKLYPDRKIKDVLSAQGCYVFVCVPTPKLTDESCDTSIVEATLSELDCLLKSKERCFVIVKSTVPPGYLSSAAQRFTNLRIIANPEFLRAVTAADDFMEQEFVVLGADDVEARSMFAHVYSAGWPDAVIITTSLAGAAMMSKYAINVSLAVKVSVMNELAAVWKAISGEDWSSVERIIKLDKRVGESHTSVPGPDGSFGFGGGCFPKDVTALLHLAQEHSIPCPAIAGAVKSNSVEGSWRCTSW